MRMTELKRCSGCREEKPKEQFHKDSTKRDGLYGACKQCVSIRQHKNYMKYQERKKAYAKQYSLDNPEKVSQGKRKYYIDNLPKFMLKSAQIRAKQDGIPCTITIDDIVIPEYCPILGIALVPSSRRSRDESPSLDKVDPDQGYVPGNVQVVSNKANTMKSSANRKELKAFADWVYREVIGHE